MGEVAVIGEQPVVRGFVLAGARVVVAQDPGQVRAAWRALPGSVVVVILTRAAAHALEAVPPTGAPLRVVLPS